MGIFDIPGVWERSGKLRRMPDPQGDPRGNAGGKMDRIFRMRKIRFVLRAAFIGDCSQSIVAEIKKQSFDVRWLSEARPVFRIIAGIMAPIFFGIGVFSLLKVFLSDVLIFDSQARFGLAATIMGIGMFILCVRGKIFR